MDSKACAVCAENGKGPCLEGSKELRALLNFEQMRVQNTILNNPPTS